MAERDEQQRERERELPAHETREERGAGGGLTGAGISAEQYDEGGDQLPGSELPEEQDDEAAVDPWESGAAYRPRSG